MCKSSVGSGRNNTIWKLSAFAPCQPATRYPPRKTSPSRTQLLPVSQTARHWPLQARGLSSNQGVKEPRGEARTWRQVCCLFSRVFGRKAEGHRERVQRLHFAPRLMNLLRCLVHNSQGFPQETPVAMTWPACVLTADFESALPSCPLHQLPSHFLFSYLFNLSGYERLEQRHASLPAFCIVAYKYDLLKRRVRMGRIGTISP